MSARDKFIALTAGFWREHTNTWMCTGEDIETFADLIRADEREALIRYFDGHWRDEWSEGQIIEALEARGNT